MNLYDKIKEVWYRFLYFKIPKELEDFDKVTILYFNDERTLTGFV